ncbi:MAG TPA: hypothetical protein VFG00_12535, partial [Acidothermaceae bacterium]|nr:hypothetical protein [Acidothermaceae bacterium]
KALSVGMSAALLGSLFATVVAPSALAAITVGNAGNVPQGGTSAANVSFTFQEQAANSIATNASGSFTVTILPALPGTGTVSFSGTPSTAGSTGSLGASASVAGNVLTVSIAGSDTNNVETIFVTGLTITASSNASLGAIRATMGGYTGSITGAAIFSAGGTATGTIASGIGAAATSVIVNVTSAGCNFVNTGVLGAGQLSFATSPESVNITANAAGPGVGQQTLTIGATASVHNAGEVVSQTNSCAASNTLASPGTVVAALSYSSAGNATVYPGESNSPASNLSLTEPSAGFLAAGSTFTFTILTPGVVFSTAPSVAGTAPTTGFPFFTYNGGAALSTPVISSNRLSATVTVNTASTAASTFTLSNILYDVSASVAGGTFISVGLTTSAAQAVLPPTNTNAVAFRGINASAPSPTVYIGQNNQTAGVITFSEASAGFFTDGIGTSTNTFEICPTGVGFAFTLAPVAMVTAGNLVLRNGTVAATAGTAVTGTQNGNCYMWTVWTASTTASTIIIGAAPSAATGALINVNVDQAPGAVLAGLYIGSSTLINPLTLAATVQFATAVYQNSVAVTALSQPAIAPGSADVAVGGISIAETALGQLKAGEQICVEVLPRAGTLPLLQDTFLAASDIADVPVATTSGGLIVGPVNIFSSENCGQLGGTPTTYTASFSFTVAQQSTAGTGKLVISNIHYTTTANAALGTVLVRVSGFGGSPTSVDFQSTISNATIGSAAPITALNALGVPPNQGPWTVATKIQSLNKYVTWQFNGGSSQAGKLIQIWVATKNSSGGWGAFALLTSRLANSAGVATFSWRSSTAKWISVRAYSASSGTWSPARQARWA